MATGAWNILLLLQLLLSQSYSVVYFNLPVFWWWARARFFSVNIWKLSKLDVLMPFLCTSGFIKYWLLKAVLRCIDVWNWCCFSGAACKVCSVSYRFTLGSC